MRDPSILSILSLFQQTGYLGDSDGRDILYLIDIEKMEQAAIVLTIVTWSSRGDN